MPKNVAVNRKWGKKKVSKPVIEFKRCRRHVRNGELEVHLWWSAGGPLDTSGVQATSDQPRAPQPLASGVGEGSGVPSLLRLYLGRHKSSPWENFSEVLGGEKTHPFGSPIKGPPVDAASAEGKTRVREHPQVVSRRGRPDCSLAHPPSGPLP